MAHNQQTLICDEHKELLTFEYATLEQIQDFAYDHHLCKLRCEQFWSAFDMEDNGYNGYKDRLYPQDAEKCYSYAISNNE